MGYCIDLIVPCIRSMVIGIAYGKLLVVLQVGYSGLLVVTEG